MIELDLEGLQKHREQTVLDILELLKTEDRVGCVRYTGYGKSYFVMRRLIEELNEKVMILVPNKHLAIQYESWYKNNNNVLIYTYQVLKFIEEDRLELIKDTKYIICDECHYLLAPKWNKYLHKILDNLDCKIIGLTATPVRGDSKNIITEWFNGVQVKPLNLIDGIALKFISKLKYVVAYAKIEDKLDKKLNDVDRYKINNLLNVPAILKKYIPEEYLKRNLKIPIFVPNIKYIEEAKQSCYNWLHEAYPDKNINVYSISSANSLNKIISERNNFIENENCNDIDILISIDMLKEGLHLPKLSVEIMLRKTRSPLVYFQQVGRVINDREPIIFDLINNQAHLYEIKRQYNNLCKESYQEHNKITFEDCVELCDTTIDIETILSHYTWRSSEEIMRIIDDNLDFLIEHCKEYTLHSIAPKIGLDRDILVRYLQLPKYAQYNLEFKKAFITFDEAKQIIDQNIDFIIKNHKILSLTQLSNHLGIGRFHLKNILSLPEYEKQGIDISVYARVGRMPSTHTVEQSKKAEEYFKNNKQEIERLSKLKTLTEIGNQFKISDTVVKRLADKYNIKLSNFPEQLRKEKMDKLLKYKSQIEENKKHLSHREWAEILGISKHSFAGDCRSLNIDINTNYKTATRLKSEEYKRKCFQYKSEMEVNNQNWCKSEWAQFLNVSWNAVDRFCESENITLPNKRNRSKKL